MKREVLGVLFSMIVGGGFAIAQTYPSFDEYQSVVPSGVVATGDFNLDGLPDVAVLNQGQDATYGLYVYFGTGEGNITLGTANVHVPNATMMRTADMNGDGFLDLVFQTASSLSIWYGDGHGHFTAGPTVTLAHPPQNFELADLNNDGRIDIVAVECGAGCGVEVKLQNASHTFTQSQFLVAGNTPVARSLKVADINRDGKLDVILATSSPSSQKILVWKGTGAGTFGSMSSFNVPSCENGFCYSAIEDLAIADFYNDTNLHLAVVRGYCSPSDYDSLNCTMALNLYKNDGAGKFTMQAPFYFGSAGGVSLVPGDFNEDQRQDLLAYSGNARNPTVTTLVALGKGTFTAYSAGAGGGMVIARDMALHSRQDLVTTWTYGGATAIAINTTNATNCPPPGSNKLAARVCSATVDSTKATALVKGSGNSPAGVQRLEIWVDGVKKAEAWSDQIAKQIALTAGTHTVTLVAVDKYKGTASTRVSVSMP